MADWKEYIKQKYLDPDLEEAQDKATENQALLSIAQGLNQIGAGTNQYKQGDWSNEEALAQKPVTDYNANMANAVKNMQAEQMGSSLTEDKELNDPMSNTSKAYQKVYGSIAKKAGIQGADQMSAKQLQGLNSAINMGVTMRDVDQKAAATKLEKEKQSQDKLDKDFVSLGKEAVNPGARSDYGQAKKARTDIGRARVLLDQYPDLDKMPPQQVQETVAAMDRVVSGAAATKFGREKLTPNSFVFKLNELKNKIQNNPGGAGVGQYLKMMKETLEREDQYFANKIDKVRDTYRNSYSHLEKADPARFKAIVDNMLYAADQDENLVPINVNSTYTGDTSNIGKSGFSPDERRARIAELQAKKGAK